MRRMVVGFAGSLLAALALGNTYTVTSTADSGAGTLRQAILDANANSGTDSIAFNIPGGGVHTIAPASAFPKLTSPVTIDGYTQPGASPNTNPPDEGLNSVLQIEIDCTSAGTYCLVIGADDVTIRGLVINRGIGGVATDFLQLVHNPVIEGCFFGTTPDGLTSLDLPAGITFGQHQNGRVGGTTPAARNLLASTGTGTQLQVSFAPNNGSVIQGNLFCTDKTGLVPIGSVIARGGIQLSGGAGAGNTSNITIGGLTPAAGNVFACPQSNVRLTNMSGVAVQGNKFGVDPSGTKGISRGIGTGVYVEGGDDTVVIGGTAAGAGNVMGSLLTGIASFGGTATVIQGNFLGTDATATIDLGNAREGISMQTGSDTTIGGTGSGEGNTILYNRNGGIRIAFGAGNSIRGNRILDNHGLISGTNPSIGINLVGSPGPDANDSCDADAGANGLQNFPIITSAAPEGGGTRVIGTLDSTASSTFTLDFYASPVCRARRRSQAQADQYLGSTMVSTNASCAASFNVLLPTATTAGQPVTATATAVDGSTSELTPEIIFSSTPIAGDFTGGTEITIEGMLFVAGATVSIGGTPATGIIVDSATKIRATAPAKPAGTVHDIVVTLPGGMTGTMRNGYVSRFTDVASGGFGPSIAKLSANAVTAGCGNGSTYCPDAGATRAQMAVFLLRSKKGLCYTPPPATGTVFTDVPANSFAAAWIEALAAEGVTTGCGGSNYCPNATVTRAQMAVFLLRMLEGSAYLPPPCTTATFGDVPCSNGFAPWIEELVHRGITAGCGGGMYCPNNPVTRGQMAVFLSTTFGLP
jgi:parallel beta-helix repeat protein